MIEDEKKKMNFPRTPTPTFILKNHQILFELEILVEDCCNLH